MGDIAILGECAGCRRRAGLVYMACKECRRRWGKRCGVIMSMIRDNPQFARECHDGLGSDSAKEGFVEMFGRPWIREAQCPE